VTRLATSIWAMNSSFFVGKNCLGDRGPVVGALADNWTQDKSHHQGIAKGTAKESVKGIETFFK